MKQSISQLSSVVISLLLLLFTSCTNNNKETHEPPDGLSGLLDSLFGYAVENQEIPGAVVYISMDGREVFHQAYGWRDIEGQKPMHTTDIFRMASMTKGLTAVAIMQLVENGKIQLDDEVNKYIPEFENPKILIDVLPDSSFTSREAFGEITIRQLLTHTSGIGYGFQNDRYNALVIKHDISEGFEDDERDSYENIRRIAELPLLFEPGDNYVYGLSMDVLGVVIEQVSGMRYDQYIEQEILAPLQMDNSYFIIPEEEQHRLVSVYQPVDSGTGLVRTSYPDTAYPVMQTKQFFSGGSDLCSTAEDYARFMQMLLKYGEYDQARILLKSSVDTILSKQSPFDEGNSYQGFAAWITNETGASEGPRGLGTFEFGGFYDTFSWADPQSGMVAVLLLQMYPNNAYSIHEKFQNLTYRVIQ